MQTNNTQTKYLSKAELKQQCPVAFNDSPTNPDVTKQYLVVKTETIIDDMKEMGWYPVEGKMRGPRKKTTKFSKHMIVFQNPDLTITSKGKTEAYPRILIENSYDGLNSFKFHVGIFRIVCANGLVIADQSFDKFTVKHKGYSFEELRKVIKESVEMLPEKIEVFNKMKDKKLTLEQKQELAYKSMLARAGISTTSKENPQYDQETVDDILDPKRVEDSKDDLWTIMNVIQEKMLKGGFHAALKQGKVRKVRPIKSYEKELKLNKQIFKQATEILN